MFSETYIFSYLNCDILICHRSLPRNSSENMFVVSFLVGYCLTKSDILSNSEVYLLIFTTVTQEFEHFEGREIGQLWRLCDESYRMLRNVASLRKYGARF